MATRTSVRDLQSDVGSCDNAHACTSLAAIGPYPRAALLVSKDLKLSAPVETSLVLCPYTIHL